MDTSTRYLTLTEAAELARISVSTMRAWIRSGRVRALRPGRRLLLVEAELHAFLNHATRASRDANSEARQLPGSRASGGTGDGSAALRYED